MNDRTQEITELMGAVDEVLDGFDPITVEAEQPAPTHSLLEVWESILANIDKAAEERVMPAEAAGLVSRYPFIRVQEVPAYLKKYYDYLTEYRDALASEIASDPKCKTHTDPSEDAEKNRHHYKNLLVAWQAIALKDDFAWDATTEQAHLELAAMNEARNFVIGSNGIVAHLEAINFTLTPDEHDEISQAVLATQES